MIESLIALALTLGLFVFITPFIRDVKRVENHREERAYMELQIGKRQLNYELAKYYFVEVRTKELVFSNKKNPNPDGRDYVYFNRYEKVIRKTPGFQPIIDNVKSVSFKELPRNIQMDIEMEGGKSYVYLLNKGK